VEPAENTLRLTPLGRMLAATMFASLTPPPGEMAGAVVSRLGRLTPRIAEKIMGPWLAARTTADAAREVLDFAAYARADLRMVATGYVRTLGADALPAWRERSKDRGVGVYARTWLSEPGERVPIDGRDLDWMHVENLSARMAATPEPIRVTLLADLGAHDPDALPELRSIVNRSRHPDAPGDRLLYVYDFGDSWDHDVIFEDFLQNDSGDTLPFLLGGSGACPPEDCAEMGDWLGSSSLDPDAFSVDKAAAAVSCLHSRRPPKVARVQAKRKKRRR
jgi:pRiA4b ORF-3-like protein